MVNKWIRTFGQFISIVALVDWAALWDTANFSEWEIFCFFSSRLPNVLLTCGDYDFQTAIVELIFRFISIKANREPLRSWFKGYTEIQNVFVSTPFKDFDPVSKQSISNLKLSKQYKATVFIINFSHSYKKQRFLYLIFPSCDVLTLQSCHMWYVWCVFVRAWDWKAPAHICFVFIKLLLCLCLLIFYVHVHDMSYCVLCCLCVAFL